jgi:hypothetical protein
MNLDHNDEIIKRRLSQKMEFLSNDLASLAQPNEEELQAYFNKNSKKYLLPYTYSLYQIIFTNDSHDKPEKVIEGILKTSENLSFEDMKSKGDNLPFPYFFNNTNSNELANQLGNSFSENIENLDLNTWVGPVSSGFGQHLVYITEKHKPTLPDLNTIRDVVLRDYQYEKQKEINDVIFETLKNDYNITFDFENSQPAQEFKSFLENKLDKQQ